MSKKLKRKALLLIALELISLIVMGVFLMNMQSRLSLNSYRNDITSEMEQMDALLADAQAEKEQSIVTDNAIYQSKAQSVAFMANHDQGFEASNSKMKEYAELLQVDNVLIVDKEGNQLAKAQDTAADFSYARYNQLRTVFSTNEPSEPVELETEEAWARYYSAKIDNETMAVVEKKPEELYALLDDTVSQASILKNISVGMDGYVFAVSDQSYAIQYHPDEELIGKDALNSGVDVEKLEDGKFSWITLDGAKYYGGVRHTGDSYYISVIPEKEIIGSRNITVGVMLFIFFAVMTIVITYGIFVMRDHEKNGNGDADFSGKGTFRCNRVVGRKAAVLSLVGVICILVISYYMQTLFSLSNQSISNKQRVEDVEKTVERYEERAAELTEQYNAWYLSKCQTAAYILENNPELMTKESIGELSDVLQIKYIYVFNSSGSVAATNSTYSQFQISQDPEDQSYEFNKLLAGGDYLIQEAQPDEVSGDFYQYIGVSMYDEAGDVDGFVQIAIHPERLEEILQNMQLSNILDGIQIGGNGFAFAVDKENAAFAYYPQSKMVGREATAYGIRESQLKDGFSDYIKIQSEKYYAASVETGDYYVYIAVPEADIMTQRIPLTLATGIISAICMVIIYCALSFSMQTKAAPAKKGAVKARKDAAQEKQHVNERMIDVTLPDGRVKKTESAESRWMYLAMAWDEKTPEQQIATVVKTLFGILAVVICAAVLFKDRIFGDDSVFAYVIDGGWEKGVNVFALTACIMIIGVVTTATELVKRLLRLLSTTFGARGETICRMISSFVKYVAIIAMLYYCFALFGVDTATLLASAGILSIAISFGAKDLVADIMSGLFIIFEGEFRVGDIVNVGGWTGTVMEIGVRTTKIEDGSRNVKIVRNSNVSDVVNMTKHTSCAYCDLSIAYGESLEKVESILQEEFPNIRQHLPAILGGPYYKGVVALSGSSVNLRIVAQCNEKDRGQLERDLNREMKLIFDKHDIQL